MNNLKNINKFIKNTNSKDTNFEIEIKLGKFINGQFSADVNKVIFNKLQDFIKNLKYKSLPKTHCIMCKKGNNRLEFFLDENNKFIHYEEMIKKKIKHIDYEKLDLRLSVSKETLLKKDASFNKNDMNDNMKCLRYKRRSSYTKNIWRFDFTEVHDVNNRMTLTHITDNLIKSNLDYRLEVEIEYIGDFTHDLEKELYEIYDEIKDVVELKLTILKNIQKVFKNKEYNAIKKSDVTKWSSHELITQVQNLDMTVLNEIINGKINYSITEKADGERFLVYIHGDDIYCIDKSLNLNNINSDYNISSNLSNKLYLFDVEFIKEINQYLIFDCIIFEDQDISHLPLNKRIEHIEKINLDTSSNIQIKQHHFSNKNDFFKTCKQVYLDTKYDYDIDGLILTPIDEQYRCNMYKWKPPDQQTIDFLIIIKYRRKLQQNSMELILDLYVKGSKKKFKYDVKLFKTIKKHSLNIPVLFSKNNSVIIKLKKNKMIYENNDLDIVIKNNSILEMSFLNGSWHPYKNRFDKDKEYKESIKKGIFDGPNGYNTAQFVKRLIHKPITTEMITTGQIYYIGIDKKHSSIKNMIKFNNFIKKDMYKNYLKKNMKLLELSGGRGGNLYDFLNKKPSYIFFTDYAKDALQEAQRRYNDFTSKNSKLKTDIVFKEFNLRNNVHNSISKLSSHIKFDLISCQFAIHYFFESKKSWTNFFNTVNNLIKKNGKFMFTCFDGKRVEKLLKKIKKNHKLELMVNDKVVLGFTKLYDSRKQTEFGRELGCFVETIGEHNEYLVNIQFIIDFFKENGYKLIENVQFNSLFNKYKISLLDVEKEFTGLYNKVVFQKN